MSLVDGVHVRHYAPGRRTGSATVKYSPGRVTAWSGAVAGPRSPHGRAASAGFSVALQQLDLLPGARDGLCQVNSGGFLLHGLDKLCLVVCQGHLEGGGLRGQGRAELRSRKMLTTWPDPPPGEISAPGRRWGISPDPWALVAAEESDEEGDEKQRKPRLSFKLPAALGETLVRAAYWTSAPYVEQLQAWDKRWGDGPTVILREAMRRNGGRVTDLDVMVAMLAPRPEAAALEERGRLRAQIVTTGTLARDALARAIR